MIEGLRVTITGSEMRSLALKRVEHHRARASFYEAQLKAIPTLDDDSDSAPQRGSKGPLDGIKDKITEHTCEADELQFMADHFPQDEQYVLDRNDLFRLGVCRQRY